jgi:putative phosphoesterase
MKIVIISDLHGNFEALSRLPEEYDELWVLGDLVNYGPQPRQVLDFVRARAAVVVRGNHDHSIGYGEDPRCTPRYARMAEETRRFTDAVLGNADKQFLRRLPLTTELERDGKRFYLCHAVPSDPLYGYCSQESDRWPAELETTHSDVLLVGHTHTPFIRQIGKQVVVNPGSLGQPKTGKPDACYAVWEDGAFELKSFSYPVERTVEAVASMPLTAEVKRDLVTVLRTGSIS